MKSRNLLRIATGVAILWGVTVAAVPAHAIVILSNLPGTGDIAGTNLGIGIDGRSREKAVGLTVGSSDLMFTSIAGLFYNPPPADRDLTGGIYSDSGGAPDSLLAAFNPVVLAANQPIAELMTTTTIPFLLMANTSYWFLFDGPDVENQMVWSNLIPNTSPTPSADVSFVGYAFSDDDGASWENSNIFNGVRIEAELATALVPEPTTLVLFTLGITGLSMVRRNMRA